MTKRVLAFVAAVVLLAGLQAQSGEKKGGLTAKGLTGTYVIVSGERDGKAIPRDKLDTATIRFTADTITDLDKDDKRHYVATYKLDADKEPAHIHMVSIEPKKGAEADGLIKLAGGQLHLVYSLPGGKAPTGFKTEEKQQMFVLKRAEK